MKTGSPFLAPAAPRARALRVLAALTLAALTLAGCQGDSNPLCVPAAESCNGIDDDCDGVVDEGDPGGGAACPVPGAQGPCAAGTLHCTAGGGGSLACLPNVLPVTEICANGIDDDCDGPADNHCCPGASCTGSTLTTCDTSNDPIVSQCPIGCAPDAPPRCAILAPSIVSPELCALVLDPAYAAPDLAVLNGETEAGAGAGERSSSRRPRWPSMAASPRPAAAVEVGPPARAPPGRQAGAGPPRAPRPAAARPPRAPDRAAGAPPSRRHWGARTA